MYSQVLTPMHGSAIDYAIIIIIIYIDNFEETILWLIMQNWHLHIIIT